MTAETIRSQPVGYLERNLPMAMARDDFLVRYTRIADQLAATTSEAVDGIGHHLDLNLADAQMIQYLASWVGLALDPERGAPRMRQAVRDAVEGLGWRGTARGLEAYLRALTGSRVRVEDSGGVWIVPDEKAPDFDPVVTVHLPRGGELSRERLAELAAEELPVGTRVRVVHPDDPPSSDERIRGGVGAGR
jgi:phage tail-like protein